MNCFRFSTVPRPQLSLLCSEQYSVGIEYTRTVSRVICVDAWGLQNGKYHRKATLPRAEPALKLQRDVTVGFILLHCVDMAS